MPIVKSEGHHHDILHSCVYKQRLARQCSMLQSVRCSFLSLYCLLFPQQGLFTLLSRISGAAVPAAYSRVLCQGREV